MLKKSKKLEERTKKIAKKIQETGLSSSNDTILLFTIDENRYAISTIELDSVNRGHYSRSLKGLPYPLWGVMMHNGSVYNILSFSRDITDRTRNKLNLIIFKRGYFSIEFHQIDNIIHRKLIKIKNVDNPEFVFLNRYFVYKDKSYYLLDMDLFNKYIEEINL
ncbi:hypothetical protein J7L48_00535 [bacterium]|nr:hypothetical protein [bacterium]